MDVIRSEVSGGCDGCMCGLTVLTHAAALVLQDYQWRWHYRAGYMAFRALCAIVVLRLPSTFLHGTQEWPRQQYADMENWRQHTVLPVMLLLILTTLAYFWVQGSDPAYLTDGT